MPLRAPAPVEASDRARPWLIALFVTGFFLAQGIFRALYLHLAGRTVGSSGMLGDNLLSEVTSSLATTLVFFAVVVPVSRRWPLQGEGWPRRLFPHLVGLIVYSVIKTLLMWGLRIPLFPLFGFGSYNYGDLLYRFSMEGAGDVLGYTVAAAAVHWWYASKRAQQREIRAARLETQLTAARLSALRGQLQPHFLFNTLNTIGSLVHEDPETADRMITRLSDLLRNALDAPSKMSVPLREEMAMVDEYVHIMLARFGDRAEVRWRVDDDVAEAVVPRFIIQPLVENAFKYGIEPRRSAGVVSISAGRTGQRLVVRVEDDGPGLDPEGTTEGTGLGLANVRGRLALLFGSEADVTVRDRSPTGAVGIISVPLSFEAQS